MISTLYATPRPSKASISNTAHEQLPTRGVDSQDRGNIKYKVDAAYRLIEPKTVTATNDRLQFGPKRHGSADLLSEMIHRMGGAQTSNSRGTFVDIAI